MQFLIVLLTFVGTCSALAVKQGRSGPPPTPPLNDPKRNTDNHGQLRDPTEPIAAFDQAPSSKRVGGCDLNSIIAASGDKLGSLVRDAPRMCISGIFEQVESKAKDACNEADVSTIGNYFYGAASSYDPAKPEGTAGMLNFILYLRACYYVQGYNENAVGKYSPNLLVLVRYGLDNFFKRPNLEAQNDVHYEIMREAISLISNAHDYINYSAVLAQLLTKVSNVWKFGSSVFIQKATQHDVVNAMYDNFFRSHYEEKVATDYYCKPHTEIPQSLSDFLDRHGDLVGTSSEWIFQNTAGELGRFSKYACIYPTISALLKKQMAKYNANSAPKVYAALLDTWSYYDSKNCATYGFCNFKAELEKKILPFSKTCDKTYTDTFKIRAQQISDAEATEVCRRLKDQESYYHNLVKDNWKPVNPDTNALIEVVIFDNSDEYKFYASKIFGIGTDNGGMYIEGDPSKAGNIARYFCYERPKNGKFDVWNLEHEFTHYLDGRYDMQGDFTASSTSGHTIWWIEGFAEYAANKNEYPSMKDDCAAKLYPLSTILNNNYNSGTNRVYHYGYLAARFMFERHRNDVETILGNFRTGQYSQYEKFITGIGSRYDQEFSQWCTCIAANKPC
jgi:microbial collagenase